MTWNRHYVPPSTLLWQGRSDSPDKSCFFQTIQLLNLLQDTPRNARKFAFGLIGFCCDEGIRRNLGRTGAAEGPPAIRELLAKFPTPHQDIIYYDVGDINCMDGDLESAQEALAEVTALLLQHQVIPIVMGGGHELAFGHYQGIAKSSMAKSLGIINFDAHFDMRPLLPDNKGSSGTPFLQIAQAQKHKQQAFHYCCVGIQQSSNLTHLFETAREYQTTVILAEDLYQKNRQENTFCTY